MPEIVRFADEDDRVHIGVRGADGTIRGIAGVQRVADLLRLPLDELRERVEQASAAGPAAPAGHTALPPVDGRTEVWAAGVTYERSHAARVEESSNRTAYDLVYDAERPELFFKSQPWRVVTEGEPIAIRSDSELNVPEPELALVVNAHAEIVGYCVCNDVSSRSIEGENALYLPQAKVYAGSCALAEGIVPAWEVPDIAGERIAMRITRGGAEVFAGEIPLAAMRRTPEELVAYLCRSQPYPEGAVLTTGTGIVPGMEFTLRTGDVVDIDLGPVGRLSNPVVEGTAPMEWLVEALERPSARRRP